MFGNKVLKIRVSFILGVLLLMTGCTVNWNIPVVNVASGSPVVTEKIPLDVGIVVPDEAETISIHIQSDLVDIFPIGQLIKNASQDVLSPAFAAATLIKGKYYPKGSNVLLVTEVKDFKANMPHYGKINMSMSMKFVLLDVKRMPVWETVVNLSKTKTGPIVFGNPLEMHAQATAELVNEIFKKAAEEVLFSPEIHAYASRKDTPATVMSAASSKAGTAAESDVDNLPTMRVKPNKNDYAIVIGVEKYRQNLPNANYAVRDATIMAEYLEKVFGYPQKNIVTLLDDRALKSDLEKYLGRWLLNNVEQDSSVFIYYSGHGAPDPKTGDAFLVPYDGDPTFIEETGYPLKRLYAKLEKLPVKEVIVVLDSCFSGAGGRSVLAKGARPLVMNIERNVFHSEKITILSAAAGNQISSTYEEKGHGLFTYFLLKGLKGDADINNDGTIGITELHKYVSPNVELIARKVYNNEQTPQLIGGKLTRRD